MIKVKKAEIKQEKDVTADDVVAEADDMYKYCRDAGFRPADQEYSKELLNSLWKRNPEFCKSYPIVARHMAQFGVYSSNALRKYLNRLKHHPWKSEEDYLESQVDYITMLFRELNPRATKQERDNVRNNVRQCLRDESMDYKKHIEIFEAEVKNLEENVRIQRRNNTLEWMREYRRRALAGDPTQIKISDPVRVQFVDS